MEHGLELRLTNKNAIPDAPRHTLRTFAEMIEVCTPENVDRFLVDFQAGFKATVLMVDLLKATTRAVGEELDVVKIGIDAFVWIDDSPRTSEATPGPERHEPLD